MNSTSVSPPIPARDSLGPESLKVMIVDDHPIVRQGLRSLIERRSSYKVCGETDNAPEAVSMAVRQAPHLALVDISLGSTNGIELTKSLSTRCPNLRILVISMHDENVYAERALRAGAKGFLRKSAAIDHLLPALDTIAAGEVYVNPTQESPFLLPHTDRARTAGDRARGLSDREAEVLAMLGEGATTRAIAEQLNLSVKTVDTYRDNLKRKLGLVDGHSLIHYAVQSGKVKDVG